ncbi:MAG TPA: transcriptional regulator [Candidatus Dormibacteraeota bacterium]|nr:transcriptional regulator [Candidatus Dormibacteraeota bacterium]
MQGGLTNVQRRFVDELGQLYARYGLALSFGRVFGLLLVSDEPVSLDEIAVKLSMSKTSASVTARELERAGVARRLGMAGTRRILYEAGDEMDPVLSAMFARIRASLDILRRAEPALASGRAQERLRTMKELHEFWLREADGIMERWRGSRVT